MFNGVSVIAVQNAVAVPGLVAVPVLDRRALPAMQAAILVPGRHSIGICACRSAVAMQPSVAKPEFCPVRTNDRWPVITVKYAALEPVLRAVGPFDEGRVEAGDGLTGVAALRT